MHILVPYGVDDDAEMIRSLIFHIGGFIFEKPVEILNDTRLPRLLLVCLVSAQILRRGKPYSFVGGMS